MFKLGEEEERDGSLLQIRDNAFKKKRGDHRKQRTTSEVWDEIEWMTHKHAD